MPPAEDTHGRDTEWNKEGVPKTREQGRLNWLFFPYDYLFLLLSAYTLGRATAITLQGMWWDSTVSPASPSRCQQAAYHA